MILDIYKLLADLQSKINGNPEISFSLVRDNFCLIVMWYENEKLFKFRYQFSTADIVRTEDNFIIEVLIARINREYAQKQLEERDE